MRTKILFGVLLVLVSLLTACGPTAEEIRAIVAEEAPKTLTAEEIRAIVVEEAPKTLTAEEIRAIVVEEAPKTLTAEEIQAIVAESDSALTAEEVKAIIAEALVKNQETENNDVVSQFVIPLSWFESQGIEFGSGLTVASVCEQGARAWQGEINFNVVPTDANIEVVEINCIQYNPGEEIPQDELITMGGVGTIWFRLPIETTLNQFGDCPCGIDGDC